MSSRSTTLVGAVVAILIIGAVASIGYYQFEVAPGLTSTTTSTTTTQSVDCTATPSSCVTVTIVSGAAGQPSGSPPLYGYSPLTITVVIGHNNTVVWKNNDTAFHTATSVSGDPAPFATGCLDGIGAACPAPSSGISSYQFTFTVAGVYTYHCDYHPWMTGKVIVLPASGSSSTTTA
jgi:plastocyanin